MISRRLVSASLVAGVLAFTVPAFVVPVEAKSPKKTATKTGEKPAGATGECNDGSYTKAKTQQGACSKHGGVEARFANQTIAAREAKLKADAEAIAAVVNALFQRHGWITLWSDHGTVDTVAKRW